MGAKERRQVQLRQKAAKVIAERNEQQQKQRQQREDERREVDYERARDVAWKLATEQKRREEDRIVNVIKNDLPLDESSNTGTGTSIGTELTETIESVSVNIAQRLERLSDFEDAELEPETSART